MNRISHLFFSFISEQETIDIERKLRYDFMHERCAKEMPEERKYSIRNFVSHHQNEFLVRSFVPHLSSNQTKSPMNPNEIFFSIQQRIEAYKPKFNWKDMDRHVRLIAKDLHRTDFISANTKPDQYDYGPLTRLLITFASYHPQIGYSQGNLQQDKSFSLLIWTCRNE